MGDGGGEVVMWGEVVVVMMVVVVETVVLAVGKEMVVEVGSTVTSGVCVGVQVICGGGGGVGGSGEGGGIDGGGGVGSGGGMGLMVRVVAVVASVVSEVVVGLMARDGAAMGKSTVGVTGDEPDLEGVEKERSGNGPSEQSGVRVAMVASGAKGLGVVKVEVRGRD